MSVTVDLPAEALQRLEAEAARRGVGIETVIAGLADTLPESQSDLTPLQEHRFGFVGIAASGDGSLSESYKDIRRAELDG